MPPIFPRIVPAIAKLIGEAAIPGLVIPKDGSDAELPIQIASPIPLPDPVPVDVYHPYGSKSVGFLERLPTLAAPRRLNVQPSRLLGTAMRAAQGTLPLQRPGNRLAIGRLAGTNNVAPRSPLPTRIVSGPRVRPDLTPGAFPTLPTAPTLPTLPSAARATLPTLPMNRDVRPIPR